MRKRRFMGPVCALIDDLACRVEKKQNPKGVPKSISLSSLLFFYVGGDDPGVRGAEEENRNKYTTI
jgi:hypothetical protein